MSSSRGDYLFTGATFGADPKTGTFLADGPEQSRSAFSHMLDILKAHDFGVEDVAHAIVWHKGEDYRAVLDPLWATTFSDPATRPVRHDIPAAPPVRFDHADRIDGGPPVAAVGMTQRIQAAVKTGIEETELQWFDRPEVPPDGALLRVEASGVGGSDPEFYRMTRGIPAVMGHENVGNPGRRW